MFGTILVENLLLAGILLLILGGAALYVYKAKKRGVKCIGCPAAKNCSSQNNAEGCCSSNGCNGNCNTCKYSK